MDSSRADTARRFRIVRSWPATFRPRADDRSLAADRPYL